MAEEEIESKDVYVKMEPLESIGSRKALLEAVMHSLQMLIVAEKFKRLRKEENSKRLEARRAIREITRAIARIQEEIPKEAVPKKVKRKAKVLPGVPVAKARPKEIRKPTKATKLEKELRDIKERLASLR